MSTTTIHTETAAYRVRRGATVSNLEVLGRGVDVVTFVDDDTGDERRVPLHAITGISGGRLRDDADLDREDQARTTREATSTEHDRQEALLWSAEYLTSPGIDAIGARHLLDGEPLAKFAYTICNRLKLPLVQDLVERDPRRLRETIDAALTGVGVHVEAELQRLRLEDGQRAVAQRGWRPY